MRRSPPERANTPPGGTSSNPSSSALSPRFSDIAGQCSVEPVGMPQLSTGRWRSGGVSSFHSSRGTSGMVRYGWNPKHSGTEAEVVGVTVVSMVSARWASSMSRVTTCGNGKLQSSRGWPP